MTEKLTLDTNLIREWMDQRDKVDVVNRLLELGRKGAVELAVTARIHQDIWYGELAERLQELPDLGIETTGSVTRLGLWELGRDLLGSQAFLEWAEGLALDEPDGRDFDHLHAHMLQERDFFLTWDKAILRLKETLWTKWHIRACKPEDFLAGPGRIRV
jgi:hypothetical protein